MKFLVFINNVLQPRAALAPGVGIGTTRESHHPPPPPFYFSYSVFLAALLRIATSSDTLYSPLFSTSLFPPKA